MSDFNGFRVAQYLCGGPTQWATTIMGIIFFIKTVISFSGFNLAMMFLFGIGTILLIVLHQAFYFCAQGRDIEIAEKQNQ